jgi:hypothetical protein
MPRAKQIGKITATEKKPTTIDEFYFWTKKETIIKPFVTTHVLEASRNQPPL